MIRKIDDKVWRLFKSRAAAEGITARALLFKWIHKYAEGSKEKA